MYYFKDGKDYKHIRRTWYRAEPKGVRKYNDKYVDCLEWCEQNVGKENFAINGVGWYFRNPEGLTMFVLKWCGDV